MRSNNYLQIEPCTLETIDEAYYNFVNDGLDLYCSSNDGWKKIPVLWTTPERAFQIKSNIDLRDKYSTFTFPLITIHRSGVVKDPAFKGSYQANLGPNRNRRLAGREINQAETSKYATIRSLKQRDDHQINYRPKNQNPKVVYNFYYAPIPIYLTVNYKINIITNYQEQMNEIHQSIASVGSGQNYFVINNKGHNFECFMDKEFQNNGNMVNLQEEERKYTTEISTRVLGYLIGENTNKKDEQVRVEQNVVSISFPAERVVQKRKYPLSVEQRVTPPDIVTNITALDNLLSIDNNGFLDDTPEIEND